MTIPKKFLLAALAVTLIQTTGCSSKGEPAAEPTASLQPQATQVTETESTMTPAQSQQPDPTPSASAALKADKNAMMERSLISTGNTYRMKRVIEQAKSGKDVTVAYLGGSITEGFNSLEHSYAKQSFQYFADYYGTGSNVKYVNAGMAGTPSTLGLIRVDRDVLDHEPDVVFVEFAVNDSTDAQSLTAYESLVRRLMNSKKQPAVVLVFTLTETGYSVQNEMETIGSHYGLPMISVKNAIQSELQAGTMTWKDYSDDTVHPDRNGHTLIADMIQHYYTVLEGKPKDSEAKLPDATVYGKDFEGMVMLDAESFKPDSLGTFDPEPTIKQFPTGWSNRSAGGNQSFSFDVTASSLFIVIRENNDPSLGAAVVLVDGEAKLALDGNNSSGWNNPTAKLVFRDSKVKKHHIEVKMGIGSEQKEFSILAFGVVK
ncbi:SGNH/GDSL hydrolase family protein [Gorillibacterium sp. CAU 1737]|uniref:SGNH/GDSL hydrolase family protein n=1 Tax=Gorillibacterium sp. CAU 1737 TaxID=3140362 RepID=UPI00326163FD